MSLFSGAACNVKIPFSITTACDFNQADSDHMTNTPASDGNQRTFTLSVWVKIDADNDNRTIFHANTWPSTPFALFSIDDSDKMKFNVYTDANYFYISTAAVTEGSWQHLVWAIDSTQSTQDNRVKMYVNGTQVTSFAATNKIPQNLDTGVNQDDKEHQVGEEAGLGNYFNGEMAEMHMVDGSQLAPSSFAEDDGGTWTAIEYTGTHGTAGFYLDFKDASDLGNDVSGNGEHFAEVNIVSGNQITSNLPPSKG